MGRGGKVGLMRWALGDKHFLEVPRSIIGLLQASMKDLRETVDIEQKFDIFYSNFIELEQELAAITIRDAYRNVETITDLFDDKQAITRRVGNLLSSARLYVDQIKHHISALFPKDLAKKSEVEAYFHHEYDTLLGYRVMEALRNYSQHRGLPVHGTAYSANWMDDGKPTQRLEYNASLSISMKELEADGSIKASVMEELTALEPTVDLKPLIREYVEGLANVHGKIRTLLDPRVRQAEDLVLHWRAQFTQQAKLQKVPVGLVAGRLFKDGTAEEFFSLTDNPIIYAAKLRSRTRSLQRLSMRAVSTRKAVNRP